jgi:hypothetical protein
MHPKEKTDLWPRFVSLFRPHGDRSIVGTGSHQSSAKVVNLGAGPSGSGHAPIRSVPDVLLPASSSIPQYHKSLPPIRPSRSENNIVVEHSQSTFSTPSNKDSPRQRPLPPLPALHSYDNPPAFGAHDDPTSFLPSISGRCEPSCSDYPPTRTVPSLLLPPGSLMPQYHGSLPPTYPSRSENNIGESSHPAALSMPRNDNLLRQHSHSPLPSLQSFNNPGASGAHGGATAFFPGASGFQVGEFKVVNVNGAGDRSIDGTSIH